MHFVDHCNSSLSSWAYSVACFCSKWWIRFKVMKQSSMVNVTFIHLSLGCLPLFFFFSFFSLSDTISWPFILSVISSLVRCRSKLMTNKFAEWFVWNLVINSVLFFLITAKRKTKQLGLSFSCPLDLSINCPLYQRCFFSQIFIGQKRVPQIRHIWQIKIYEFFFNTVVKQQ